jgi:DNA/RNA endonuclease YhcR with UshA esterase domain
MGGRYPDEAFSGVVFQEDASQFPNLSSLEGRTVDISGRVRSYGGGPEIVLKSAAQLQVRQRRAMRPLNRP